MYLSNAIVIDHFKNECHIEPIFTSQHCKCPYVQINTHSLPLLLVSNIVDDFKWSGVLFQDIMFYEHWWLVTSLFFWHALWSFVIISLIDVTQKEGLQIYLLVGVVVWVLNFIVIDFNLEIIILRLPERTASLFRYFPYLSLNTTPRGDFKCAYVLLRTYHIIAPKCFSLIIYENNRIGFFFFTFSWFLRGFSYGFLFERCTFYCLQS